MYISKSTGEYLYLSVMKCFRMSQFTHTTKFELLSPWGYDRLHVGWGSSANTVSDYRMDHLGLIPCTGKGLFLQPLPPDQLWGSPSLLSNGYGGPVTGVKREKDVTTNTYPQIVLRSRMSRNYPLPFGAHMAVAGQLYDRLYMHYLLGEQ
jgi:hypothetical protein